MNKFLKLLLIALVAAVLPGCGSEKTNSSSSKQTALTAEEQAAADAAAKADEVNPDFATFFKLLETSKAVVVTLGAALPKPAAGDAAAGFESGSVITFVTAGDLKSVTSLKITNSPNAANANGVQALQAAATAAGDSLTSDQLKQFALTVVKSGDVPSVSIMTPNTYGKGIVNAGVNAANADNGTNQTQRKFTLKLINKLGGTDAAQNGDAQLDFTIEGKVYSVPVKVTIG